MLHVAIGRDAIESIADAARTRLFQIETPALTLLADHDMDLFDTLMKFGIM